MHKTASCHCITYYTCNSLPQKNTIFIHHFSCNSHKTVKWLRLPQRSCNFILFSEKNKKFCFGCSTTITFLPASQLPTLCELRKTRSGKNAKTTAMTSSFVKTHNFAKNVREIRQNNKKSPKI